MRLHISRPTTTLKGVRGLAQYYLYDYDFVGVVLSGVIPGMKVFGICICCQVSSAVPIFRSVKMAVPTLIEIVIILVAAFLSFKTTKSEVRTKNHFTWGAIEEVAVFVYRYLYHHGSRY